MEATLQESTAASIRQIRCCLWTHDLFMYKKNILMKDHSIPWQTDSIQCILPDIWTFTLISLRKNVIIVLNTNNNGKGTP
jgi:hypothetical protein